MISYEKHFKPLKPDGRYTSVFAAHMEKLRRETPKLAFSPDMSKEEFLEWQVKVKAKVKELIKIREFTKQPSPKRLSVVKRDTYTVEKWEYYPDEYLAIPFLILIPDIATKENPAPGVMCFPGSCENKESMAGEPTLNRPMCDWNPEPERDRIAYYMVKNGMVAFAFDNIETGETALDIEGGPAILGRTREHLCYGLLQDGESYVGLSVFYKLCIMDFIKGLDYIDSDRLGIASHSLGTETALYLALATDDFKALVFNNALRDQRHNYVSLTEYEHPLRMYNNIGNWHILPEVIHWFDFPDLCAAAAPMHIAFTEGGAEYWLNKVHKAYEIMGVPERVKVAFYPKFADEKSRNYHEKPKDFGLSREDFDDIHYIEVDDHAFRAEPAVELLKQCFKI